MSAFFALLALVPTLVALVSLYGLVADPADVQSTVEDSLRRPRPRCVTWSATKLETVVESEPSGLRTGVIVGLALALWSASSGTKHLMGGR